jgi:hypothetical protein
LKFRREAKESDGAGMKRRGLAGELKGILCEMDGFLTAGWREGRLSDGEVGMTLERMHEELYGIHPEFEEAEMELRERLRTHWQDYLQEGERKGRQEGM